MTKNIDNWIFVTGAPRSGTTFVGKVLSMGLHTDYLHEPFLSATNLPIDYERYKYMEPEDPEYDQYKKTVRMIINYDLNLSSGINPNDAWYVNLIKRIVGGRGPMYLKLAKLNPFHKACVIKDPTACFLTSFLYRRFKFHPVIVARHPVSLVASLKRLGWHPTLSHFREQRLLYTKFFSSEDDFLSTEYGKLELDGAAHWRAVYKVLLKQHCEYPERWILVRHEDICSHPISTFRRLYRLLDLPWNKYIEWRIKRLTSGTSPRSSSRRAQDLKRKSSDIFDLRRSSIPLETRQDIYNITKDVALQLYNKDSFQI